MTGTSGRIRVATRVKLELNLAVKGYGGLGLADLRDWVEAISIRLAERRGARHITCYQYMGGCRLQAGSSHQ